MGTYRKKLIEVALPLQAINEASAREKSIRHGHPSTLHLWWARRPLAACRAVLFSQLVDDPSGWPDRFPSVHEQDQERKRLFAIISELVVWKNSNRQSVLGAAQREIAISHARSREAEGVASEQEVEILSGAGDPSLVREYLATSVPPIHDPFAGGGSIPLEAQRLGLRAIGTDLNPVSVMINRALIEIPPKFAGRAPVGPTAGAKKQGRLDRRWPGPSGLAEDVRRYGSWVGNEAYSRLAWLYPQAEISQAIAAERPDLQRYVGTSLTVIAWIWARTVRSPDPAFSDIQIPLASTFVLARKPGKEAWVEPILLERGYRFDVRAGVADGFVAADDGTSAGKWQAFSCLMSDSPVDYNYIRAEALAGRMGTRLLATVALGERERVYLSPTQEMEALAERAQPTWRPEADINFHPRDIKTQIYGLTKYADLFTRRQLVALTTLSDLIGEARAAVRSDALKAGWSDDPRGLEAGGEGATAYCDAVAVYLAFTLSRSVDRGSSICTWDSSPKMEALRNTFGRQAIPMTWDFAEGNPFSGASGSWNKNLSWTTKALEMVPLHSIRGKVSQEDAAASPLSREAVVSTDPPYYDNIGYADLSDFFYVWLRRTLGASFPKTFGTMLVPKAAELVATPYRHGGDEAAEAFFLDGMTRALDSIAATAPADTPSTIYYAFKQSELKLEGLASTGWETFLEAILRSGLTVTGTWPVRTELANRMIASGANALASSIVLVCRRREVDAASITRSGFRRLLKRELPSALRQLQKSNIAPVDLAQASVGPGMSIFSRHSNVLETDGAPMTVRSALQLIHEVMDELRGEDESELDLHTRFAITWFENFGFEVGPYGDAETLAKARTVSVAGVVDSGICTSVAGKVKLVSRQELPLDWDPATDLHPTAWEAAQHLISRLDRDGEGAAAELLARIQAVRERGGVAEAARLLAYRLYTICERKRWADEARAYNLLVMAWPELVRLAAQSTPEPPRQTEIF